MVYKTKITGKIKPTYISRSLKKASFKYKGKKYSGIVIRWQLVKGKGIPYVLADGKALRVDLSE